MVAAILYLLLLVCLIAGLAIVFVNMPGLWLMALAANLRRPDGPPLAFVTLEVR